MIFQTIVVVFRTFFEFFRYNVLFWKFNLSLGRIYGVVDLAISWMKNA